MVKRVTANERDNRALFQLCAAETPGLRWDRGTLLGWPRPQNFATGEHFFGEGCSLEQVPNQSSELMAFVLPSAIKLPHFEFSNTH